MGQYKVPQNVEAEDKILGPLSLKQFIYALIGVGWGLLTFALFQKFIIGWIFIGIPPMLLFLAVGLYQKKDQPFETYLIAVISYFVKPRRRYWEKEPIAEVFHVEPTPPKPELEVRNPREVRGQLQELAQLVDTRGWSSKSPEVQEASEQPIVDLRDRLGAEVYATTPSLNELARPEVTMQDDILDTQNNAKAQSLGVLIENTVQNVRTEALAKMKEQPKAAESSQKSASAMTPPASSAILKKIALEETDLTVSQLAAKAERESQATLQEGQAINLRPNNA